MPFNPFQSVPYMAVKAMVSSKAVKMMASAGVGAAWGAAVAGAFGLPPWQGAAVGSTIGLIACRVSGEEGSWAPAVVGVLLPAASDWLLSHGGLGPILSDCSPCRAMLGVILYTGFAPLAAAAFDNKGPQSPLEFQPLPKSAQRNCKVG